MSTRGISILMEDPIRYRITGAIFLLAVAMVFLPMVFDGDGLPELDRDFRDVPGVSLEFLDPEKGSFNVSDSEINGLRANLDLDGYSKDTGTLLGNPRLSEITDLTEIWAVQVASFTTEENALQLRDSLRSQGFEGFLSRTKSESGILHRVAVGPIVDEKNALSLLEEIGAKFELQPRLMAFSENQRDKE